MKSPAGHMANKGVSSYEHHMQPTPQPAHMGSKNSEPHNMTGGHAGGPAGTMAPSSLHNFQGQGVHVANSSSM